MYNKTILDNGIKIITEEINEFKSASIGIWVHAGPKDETREIAGMSHFIEHMLFKGTKTHTATDIAEIMDSVGGHLNAFTEKEETCYYTRVIDKHIPLAIEMLTDMFLNSLFAPEEIERERGVILEEIRMYEDAPEDVVFEEFNKTLWGDHPLGAPTLGNIDTVSRFQREDFMKYIADYYTPDKITFAAAGHFKHQDIVELVKRDFGGLKGKVRCRYDEPLVFHKRNKIRTKDVEQVYLVMGGKGIPQKDERKFSYFVLDSILGGSMSSRLFQEIREKRGLVYTVSTFANSYCDAAQFGVYACTGKDNIIEVINLANSILDDIKDNGITEKELIRSKEHIKGGVALALESTSSRMIRLNKSELYHNRLVPVEEIIEKVDKVTIDDVNKLAKELLDRKSYSATVLGPVEDIEDKILSAIEG